MFPPPSGPKLGFGPVGSPGAPAAMPKANGALGPPNPRNSGVGPQNRLRQLALRRMLLKTKPRVGMITPLPSPMRPGETTAGPTQMPDVPTSGHVAGMGAEMGGE